MPVFAWRIFGINFAQHKIIMKVICAWCEQEGKETLIGEAGLYDRPMTSHGICEAHKKVLLTQIEDLRMK